MKLLSLKFSVIRRFTAKQDGAGTIFALFLFVITGMIGALGLDYTRLVSARTELQVAADLAAHSALYFVDDRSNDHASARARAIELVETGMPDVDFGDVLVADDIHFGTWDYGTQTFTIDETSRAASMVTTSRLSSKTNAVSSFLFRLVGLDSVGVVTEAVFTTYRPACFREGYVGDGIVDVQSNNEFYNGFCIHSNEYVSVNQNNYYEEGVIVSMPNESHLDMPASGYEQNDGLEEALRSAAYRMRVIAKMDEIMQGLEDGNAEYIPSYITNTTVRRLSGKRFDNSDFTPGRMYEIPCNGKATITLNAPLREVVIMASCEIKFGQASVLEDVIITNTSTAVNSFNSPSSMQLGRDDGCAEGGDVQMLTKGGVSFTSDFRAFGSQIIASGDVAFTANANGIEGISVIAGGEIDATSNGVMGFCDGDGMNNNFEAEYFRLAG